MRKIITYTHPDQIFKPSIYVFSSDLSPDKIRNFEVEPAASLGFISRQTVNGKYFTRFSYDMRTDWYKNGSLIMERKSLLPGAKQVRGFFGFINQLSYFTILVPVQNRTRRIVAVWCDAGGKLPIIGKIRAKYKDLGDGIKISTKEMMEYFSRNPD
jgi:hypothetical protein